MLASDVGVRFAIGGDGATSACEVRVAENELDAKASFGVYAVDPLWRFDKRAFFSVFEDFRCDETNVAGNRHEEWDLVDKHYVHTYCEVAIVFHNRFRDVAVFDGLEYVF